jgi:hypothetical protein
MAAWCARYSTSNAVQYDHIIYTMYAGTNEPIGLKSPDLDVIAKHVS